MSRARRRGWRHGDPVGRGAVLRRPGNPFRGGAVDRRGAANRPGNGLGAPASESPEWAPRTPSVQRPSRARSGLASSGPGSSRDGIVATGLPGRAVRAVPPFGRARSQPVDGPESAARGAEGDRAKRDRAGELRRGSLVAGPDEGPERDRSGRGSRATSSPVGRRRTSRPAESERAWSVGCGS